MIPPDKLIRDKYNEIIEPCRLKIVDHPAERFILLIKKIKEELNELEETAYNDVNEYADVIETLYAIHFFIFLITNFLFKVYREMRLKLLD